MHNKFIILLISFFFILGNTRFTPVYGAEATTTRDTFTSENQSASNVNEHNYDGYCSKPSESYLLENGDGYMRVQASNIYNDLVVEYFDAHFQYQKSLHVTLGLPLFGGFYSDGSHYYVVTGQFNKNQSDDLEVYRITKYDTSWKELKSASLKGANTYEPFEAGNCRMDMNGDILAIHTCHTMYATGDGYHHQANVNILVDTASMTIKNSFTRIANIDWGGYISHSFDQFVKIDDGKLIEVSLGDAYPRSVVMTQFDDVTNTSFTYGSPKVTTILDIKGVTGDNYTGVTLGGFEMSKDHYLVAGTTISQTSAQDAPNVFLSAIDKSTDQVNTQMITHYTTSDDAQYLGTPFLVKLNDTSFMLLWSDNKNDQSIIHYEMFDQSGHSTSEEYTMNGELSDCSPLVSNGKIIWYTYSGSQINFYDISTSDLSDHHVTYFDVPMDQVTISNVEDQYTYAGTSIQPTATLTYLDHKLEQGKDYTISYEGNDKAGYGKVTFTGIHNFTGSISKNFKVIMPLNYVNVGDVNDTYTYTGYPITPSVTLSDHDSTVYSYYYQTDYDNNTNVGQASIKVTASDLSYNNYSGSITKTFTIVPQSLDSRMIYTSGVHSSYTYTGSAITPEPQVKYYNKKLIKDTDYTLTYSNNVNAGTATITLKGIGNFTGEKTITFTIKEAQNSTTHNNTNKIIKSTITPPNKTDTSKTSTNTTIQTKDDPEQNAQASITEKKKITLTSLKKAKVSKLLQAYGYTGKVIKPSPVIKLGSITLRKNKDYTITYKNNKKKGKATLIVKGKGLYTGTITKSFKIVRKKSLKKAQLRLLKKTYKYTKKAIKPAVKVKLGKKILKKNVDYTITYKNNKKKGKAIMIIKGKNLYQGTKKITFMIK